MNKIKTATRDIPAFKLFEGTNSRAISPIQDYPWGVLRKGRILKVDNFVTEIGICCPGIHSSRNIRNAKMSYCGIGMFVIWEVVIPKGTKYYLSTVEEAREKFDGNATKGIFRSERIKLVRHVLSGRDI
jgi:hypothetical protein